MKKYLIIAFFMIVATSSFATFYSAQVSLYHKGCNYSTREVYNIPPSFTAQCDAYSSYLDRNKNWATSDVWVKKDPDVTFFSLWNDSNSGNMTKTKSVGPYPYYITYCILRASCQVESNLPGYVYATACIWW